MTTAPARPGSPGHHLAVLAALAAAAILVMGCGGGSGDLGTIAPPPGSSAPSIVIPSPEATPQSTVLPSTTPPSAAPVGSPSPSPVQTTTLRAYFMLGSFTGDGGLAPVLRTIPRTQAVGAAAMTQLLSGPVGNELAARPALFTSVPAGSRFLGLEIVNGVAIVDLSGEFAAGGTSATLAQRYGQVVFTLTQFPTVTGVQFEIDGDASPAVTSSGTTSDPVERADYRGLLPAIWVDRPAWGGALPSGSTVSGLANVFEAQFRLRVLNAGGSVIADLPVSATCGTGCWGTFAIKVSYTVTAGQWGTLRVFDPSAKDGSPTHVVDYPVWLMP